MSMSMHIVGFRSRDEKWVKMEEVWDACKAAGVEPPGEVVDFFGGQSPSEALGVEVYIEKLATTWRNNEKQGFDLDMSKIPKDLTHIRFYCAW